MLYVSVARHGNRWSLTTPNGIAAEKGARSKTLRNLARSSTMRGVVAGDADRRRLVTAGVVV